MIADGHPSLPKLAALGFCGADDTVNPRLIALISQKYPLVEWGILFRPDKEGLPRYATNDWVHRLCALLKTDKVEQVEQECSARLAAHLCGSYVNDLLSSSSNSSSAAAIDEFLNQLHDWGFRRVQVNATAINGVQTKHLGDDLTIESFLRTVRKHEKLEFIVQKNEETLPLWSGLLSKMVKTLENVVFLHDESKGTGKEILCGWPTDAEFVSTSRRTIGFAGGIKPSNIRSTVRHTLAACKQAGAKEFWIDMESGLRTTILHSDGSGIERKEDIFDIAKCYQCIDIVCESDLMRHPPELS